MPYTVNSKKTGKQYFLHLRNQVLKGGQTVKLFYFAGEAKPGVIEELPAGYEVGENSKTGLPFLQKIK